MTVSNETRRVSAVGTNTVGQEIPFAFPIKDTSDLTCFSRVTSTGVETSLTETTNYTVTIDGNDGGTITLVTAVVTTAQFHAERNTPQTQNLGLPIGGAFSGPDVEDGFDKVTRIAIDNKDATDRAMHMPATDSASLSMELPSAVDRASKVASFDSSGNASAISAVPVGSVAFTTFGTNMAEAANAAAGKVVINLDHVVDIRDHGAVSGAGDVTSEVQAAIDAVEAANGGTVFFPPGTWNFASGLLISGSSGVTLTGNSYMGQSTILNYLGTGTFIKVQTSFNKIANLRIVGPDDAAGAPISIGIDLALDDGLDRKRENIVEYCLLRDWEIGIQMNTAYSEIRHCDILLAATNCVLLVAGVENKLRDVYMTGEAATNCVEITAASKTFTLEGCTMSAAARGITTASTNALIILGCHFETLTEFDLRNTDGSSTTLMMGCNADGNISIGTAEITLISNFFESTVDFQDNGSPSNWVMLHNRNVSASNFSGGQGNILWLDQSRIGLVAFTAADETPDVNGGVRYSTNNSSAGNITDFDKGWASQIITLIGNDAGLTTIANGQGIELKDSRDFTLLDGDTLSLMYNGTDWFETGRGHNTSVSTDSIVCNDNQVVCNGNMVVIN